MTLTFGIHVASCIHLVDCLYQLLYLRLQEFLKKSIVFSHTNEQETKIDLVVGLGQPTVIISTNFIVFEYPTLQGHRPFSSGEEDFLKENDQKQLNRSQIERVSKTKLLSEISCKSDYINKKVTED